MKNIKLVILVSVIFTMGTTISCERDDICPESTSTTPNLLIDFLDYENQENSKNVFDLLVIGADNDDALALYDSTDDIALPLKTTEDSTQFILIKGIEVNDNDTPDDTSDDFLEGGNSDTVTINYTRKEVYVSRACGYITIFEDVVLTIETDSDNWIELSQSANENQPVEDETTTHFNLFH